MCAPSEKGAFCLPPKGVCAGGAGRTQSSRNISAGAACERKGTESRKRGRQLFEKGFSKAGRGGHGKSLCSRTPESGWVQQWLSHILDLGVRSRRAGVNRAALVALVNKPPLPRPTAAIRNP